MPDDPERLADAASRSQLGELFASASRDVPSDEQLAALAGKLGPILDAAPAAPRAVSGTSSALKLVVAVGAVAVLIAAGLTLRRSSQPLPVSSTVTPNPTQPAADAVPALPASTPPAPAGAEPAASASDVSTAPALDKPDAAGTKQPSAPSKALSEAALLEQARRALGTSPSTALQLANQHRARFPNGVLNQEREVIAIEALRRLHRTTEADQRAAGFSKAFAGSAHQRMVDEVAPK